METKTCTYKPCSKSFEAKRSDKKYCSQACRSKDSVLRSATGTPLQMNKPQTLFDTPIPRAEIAKPDGLSFQMQYVFDSQKKEIERWEKLFNDERDKRKKLAEEKTKVVDELAALKTDMRIAEVSKPGGLAGFMENSFVKELAPHMGPVLAGVLARVLNPAMPIEGGTVVENDATAQWVTTQPEGVQMALRTLIAEVAKLSEPEKIIAVLERFKNQLQKNQPFVVGGNGGPVKATGSFGI